MFSHTYAAPSGQIPTPPHGGADVATAPRRRRGWAQQPCMMTRGVPGPPESLLTRQRSRQRSQVGKRVKDVFKKLIFTFLYAIWLTFDVNNANCLEVAIGSQLKIIHKIRLKKFENKSKQSRFIIKDSAFA